MTESKINEKKDTGKIPEKKCKKKASRAEYAEAICQLNTAAACAKYFSKQLSDELNNVPDKLYNSADDILDNPWIRLSLVDDALHCVYNAAYLLGNLPKGATDILLELEIIQKTLEAERDQTMNNWTADFEKHQKYD